ncbi:MAG TPA: hypothetical protein VE976_01480 [Actinomycetota bacterium]|nr:hypothetical protein [Actinomycetota bacterium]
MTPPDAERPGIERVLSQIGDIRVVEKLSRLSGPDLTTLLLDVASRRASGISAADVLARSRTDRFSRPNVVPWRELRRVEDAFIAAVPSGWRWVALSPLVPFGAHARLGNVTQDWVVATVRANEVAADPTVGLALEAADARRDTATRRSGPPQRLAGIQRIVRAQLYASPEAFTHFEIFGLVTAGRGQPGNRFEIQTILEHLDIYVTALSGIAQNIAVLLSVADTPAGKRLFDAVTERSSSRVELNVTPDPERLPNQRYYRTACFKVRATMFDEDVEIADGGFTDWSERLLNDRHERLLISGAGLDRPARLMGARDAATDR